MISLCTSIDTLAMAYLDDELADEELRDFELHLRDCDGCRARLDAERAALADLRRRLTPPPTPDLVRARLSAVLDAEDASAAREDRRSRLAGWILPGVATATAFAALAMFVFVREPPRAIEAVAADVVEHQVRSPRIVEMPRPVVEADRGGAVVAKVATWTGEVRGRTVHNQLHEVRRSWGDRHVVQVSVFDARGWDLERGDRVIASGIELWVVATPKGQVLVVHRDPQGIGHVFTSDDLGTKALIDVIVETQLLQRVDARLRE
jgi:hypothetical protein